MNMRPQKVLIVDDQPLLAETLGAILTDAGYETATALSGEEAITVAPAFLPDCLLTDVSMPGIDGIQAAIAIQKTLPKCRVLLISGHAVTKDLLRDAIANGHNFEVLAKPIHPTELLAKIQVILAAAPEPIAKVLNVDDNEIHRYAVTQLLVHQGLSVKEASSGEQALQLAREFKPDIILADINMPGMNGYELCSQLKADPETARIPVIHLTNTYKNEEAKEMSKRSGAAEYLMHPVDQDALFTLLTKLVVHGKNAAAATA
jgi:CheY-like chemotaxis protein